jgi:hypothetical protein
MEYMDLQRIVMHFAIVIQLHTLRTSKGLRMTHGLKEWEKYHGKNDMFYFCGLKFLGICLYGNSRLMSYMYSTIVTQVHTQGLEMDHMD